MMTTKTYIKENEAQMNADGWGIYGSALSPRGHGCAAIHAKMPSQREGATSLKSKMALIPCHLKA